MKVVEHEFSFITFNKIQSIINDVKILQRLQNYLKMCAWCKMLFIENIILLKNLNQAFCMLNSDYFLTWWSRASDHFESKFCKRVIAKVIEILSSMMNLLRREQSLLHWQNHETRKVNISWFLSTFSELTVNLMCQLTIKISWLSQLLTDY